MQGMFKYTPGLATVAAMQENYDRQDESLVNRQKGLQDVLKAQQDYAFNEQNNPLKLENSRLTNRGLEAGLPGIEADSTTKVLGAERARATQQGTIDSTNSGNALATMQNKLKQYTMVSDTLTNAAAEVQRLPPVMRAARLRSIMEESGMKVDSPAAKSLMEEATMNPQALIKRAEEAKRRAAELTPEFIKQAMMEREHTARNTADNASRERVASTQANARVTAAQSKANGIKLDVISQVQTGKLKASEVPAAFRAAALREQDPELKQWLLQEAALAHQANLDRGNARAQPGIDEGGNLVKDKPDNVYKQIPVGTKMDGYTFKGGNPADKNNWVKD